MSEDDTADEFSEEVSEIVADNNEMQYKGCIKLVTIFSECNEVCAEMIEQLAILGRPYVIAFDMDWTFNQFLPKCHDTTSVIEFCADFNHCSLFYIRNWPTLPQYLVRLIENVNVRLVGFNIHYNIRKLWREYPMINMESILSRSIDISEYAHNVANFPKKLDMNKLMQRVFNRKMSYRRDIRLSYWNDLNLSPMQLAYAALKVHATLMLYRHFRDLDMNEQD